MRDDASSRGRPVWEGLNPVGLRRREGWS